MLLSIMHKALSCGLFPETLFGHCRDFHQLPPVMAREVKALDGFAASVTLQQLVGHPS